MARLNEAPRPKLRTVRATSAGGIVVRLLDGRTQLVLGKRRRDRDAISWTLPKGTPHDREQLTETALREVTEETGLQVELGEPVGAIEYWFVQGGTRIHKTVHYFVMTAIGGDTRGHDHEFDDVRWFDLDEAERLMSHETERRLVSEALPAVERQLRAGQPAAPLVAD